ncbi:DUF2829 domain-containing protein (plasmid) [Aneurinibacillus thermoaerophilus]|jgi:hypothetical protein|uniref:DUF2829 domain-containing protein n=1 Tax=Aneurinibacillus thermoaerophilus TaxID=143495 RepID=A0ABX8YH73_ANETH|nr:DUF2829 domain-containing protein [Aneurinibacillus thermoaerophilus]QYY44765.1 DUF2829 domain-containing protein [Aneurinibacillus thermoaerophilus]
MKEVHELNGVTVEEMKEMGAQFGFDLAIDLLKEGHKLARAGWNGKGMWVHIQRPDENSKMTLPYIYMKTADNNLVPWLISQTDALAEDWMIVE